MGEPRVALPGTTILATGGLGTLARTFALEAARADATVVLVDLAPRPSAPGGDSHGAGASPASELAATFARAGVEPPELRYADITKSDEVWRLFESVEEALGGIDVVVNFAGVHHPPFDLAGIGGPDELEEVAATFARVLDVNLQGAFLVTAAAARFMVSRRAGHIIHLCSNGSRASLYGSYAYNASKHGVEGLVKTAAAQLAPLGVRVNGVAPGTVVTDLNRSLSFTDAGDRTPRAKSILAHTPTKRFATAEGVAETILAMCLPQKHFTGNVVFCDDGYNIEGHSWPDGNVALYEGADAVDRLYDELDHHYPRNGRDNQ
ncbi:MAG: SDR family NAD(P)-dependent oxidoreductase [Spirochaetota bacterium]